MLYNPRTVAAIAAASLLAAFAAQANKGAEYQPKHHKEHHKNFFITGGATYLEPSFNGLTYVAIAEINGINASSQGKVVDPEFNWGYFIQAGYRISHHYDVEASWAQYNSKLSDSVSVDHNGATSYSLTTSNDVSNFVRTGQSASAEAKQNINYSVFDANLGQYHDITEMLRARIFAGIRYAKIDADIDNTYLGFNLMPTGMFDNYDSSFSGVGPEVGLDLEYKVWHTIGVVGHLTAAFLIGKQDVSSNVFNDSYDAQVQVNDDSTARMIPALDAKLGANWNVPYFYEKCSFGIEAGYQVAYYWDVIDQIQFPSSTDLPQQNNYANYGNMGPYLNFTAMF